MNRSDLRETMCSMQEIREKSVNKLIVIAGPSAVGKSFLINRLQSDAFPQFSAQLGITEPALWSVKTALDLEDIHELQEDRLIVHYDLTRPWKRRLHSGYMEDQPLTILQAAIEITFITLLATPEILLARFFSRRGEHPVRGIFRLTSLLKPRHKDITRLYRNPSELLSLYIEWTNFCKKFSPKAHWIVDATKEPLTFTSLSEHSTAELTKVLTP